MAQKQTNRKVTPRQLKVLTAIADLEASQCYSPTMGEVADALSVSRSTVYEHVAGLRKKQLVSESQGKARCLSLTAQAKRLLKTARQLEASPDLAEPCQDESRQGGGIALLGRVAAGVPIEAIEDRQQITLNDLFGDSDDVFALQVCGDSMTGDGIFDGDYVVCKRAAQASNGQMVVAIVDEQDATVKRFYRQADQVRLQASNEAYEPIFTSNCRVEAIVLGVLRSI